MELVSLAYDEVNLIPVACGKVDFVSAPLDELVLVRITCKDFKLSDSSYRGLTLVETIPSELLCLPVFNTGL